MLLLYRVIGFIVHLHLPEFFPRCLSPPEFVLKRNKFLTVTTTDWALSYTVVVHAFVSSSLPAPGWICSIMPWGFHSSPWQSSSLNHPTFIPSSLHREPHQDLLARWYAVFHIPVLSGTDTACCHLHRWTGKQEFFGAGVVLLQRGGSPCLQEGWARPREECIDLHASHGIVKTPISSHCSTLSLHVISNRERRTVHTVLHCVDLLACCW